MSKLRSDELVNMEGDGSPSFPRGAVSIEPTADNHVATKLYVDSTLSAGFGNSVSDTAPANPAPGSFWTDTSVSPRVLKTWDGSSWIEFAGAAPAFTGLTVPPVEVLTPLNGAGLNDGESFTPLSSIITAVGEAGGILKDTDEILSVTGGGSIALLEGLEVSTTNGDDGGTWASTSSAINGIFNGNTTRAGGYIQISSNRNASITFTFASPLVGRFRLWGRGSGNSNLNTSTLTEIVVNGQVSDPPVIGQNSTSATIASGWAGTPGVPVSSITVRAAANTSFASGAASWFTAIESEELGVLNSTMSFDLDKVLTFPTNTNFSGLTVGDEVQTGVTITAIDDSAPSQQDVYATLNPDDTVNTPILSNGNLSQSETQGEYGRARSTLSFDVGDSNGFYAEITATGSSATSTGFAIIPTSQTLGTGSNNGIPGYKGLSGRASGWWIVDGETNGTTSTGVSASTGDVLGISVKNGTATFYVNGVNVGSLSGLSGTYSFLTSAYGAQNSLTANFGATAFTHTPPSGHVGLSETVTTYPSVTVDGGNWDVSNQSQVWSAGITTPSNSFNGGQPATDAFDGDLATFAGAGSVGEDMVFQPTTPVSYSDSVEVYISGHAGQIILNSNSPVATTDSPGWVTLVSGSSGSISSITIDPNSNRRATITSIRVDGSILVDAVEDSQVWGDYITISEGLEGSNYNTDTTNMFDGNTSTVTSLSAGYTATLRPTTVVLTPPSPITVTSGLRVWMGIDRGQSISVNGSQTNASVSAGWNDTGFTGTLTTLTIGPANAGSSSNIAAIEIDGKLLIDAGVRDLGDKKISTSIPYEKSLTFTDTTEFTRLISPLSMTDANGDIATPVSDTIANVNGNVLTFQSNSNLEYFQPGDQVQPGVSIIAVNASAPSVTVDGGSWLGADGTSNIYEISKSLRFNSDDSAYLSKDFSSAGNRQSWTWSGWVKKTKITNNRMVLFGGYGVQTDTDWIEFGFDDDKFYWTQNSIAGTSTPVFRDPSAWQHVVVNYDGSDLKFYSNGVEVYSVSKSGNLGINVAGTHRIGRSPSGNTRYFDGYLADVHFIDGQQLAPTEFGNVDSNGVWQAKSFYGTYGTNGFHLDFSDSSSNASLGYDAAGSNDWTVNNLNVYIGYDSTNLTASTYAGGAATFAVTKDNILDGTTNSSYLSTSNAYIQFEPTIPINFSDKVEVYTGSNGDQCQVDLGSGYGTATSVSRNTWVAVASGGGTLHGLRHGDTGGAPGLNAIRVDGTILTSTATASDNDSLVDTPTNHGTDTGLGGEVRGNYATLNPLDKNSNTTLSNGNLKYYGGSYPAGALGTISVSSGKWYYEITPTASPYSPPTIYFGFADIDNFSLPTSGYLYLLPGVYSYCPRGGYKQINGTQTQTTFGNQLLDTVFGVALDLDDGTLKIYADGSLLGTIASGLTGTFTPLVFGDTSSSGDTATLNFGQRPFVHAAPSGYKTLCDTNLPEPTIKDGSKHFDVVTYDGNGGTQTISGLGFSPDLVWYKTRNGAFEHGLQDSVRGVGKSLSSSNTGAEYTESSGITAFTSDGFTLDGSGYYYVNSNNEMVAWCFNAGDTTTTIAAGDLNSSAYDQSQNWTNYGSGTHWGTRSWANSFNGVIGTAANDHTLPAAGQTMTWTPTSAITVNNSVVIYGVNDTDNSTYGIKLNGGNFVLPANSGAYGVPVTIPAADIGGSLSSIQLISDASHNAPYLTAVEVDGKILADSGVSVSAVPSIGSDVRANPTAGFSIVKWVSDGSNQTVSHGLNAAPAFIIVRQYSGNENWAVYHKDMGGNNGYLQLNSTLPFTTNAAPFNSTDPTSNVFSYNNTSIGGGSGNNVLAYCFAPVEGYSAMGSYTGNGSTDGTFVYTGFKPRWVLAKKSTGSGGNWAIYDTARSEDNPAVERLYANTAGSEDTGTANIIDVLSNGFKLRGGHTQSNGTGETYVYMAFAENPVSMTIESTSNNDTQVSLDPLVASVTEIIESDGATMYVNGVTGSWRAGLYASGPTTTFAAPSPADIEFTSMNQSTTPYTGAAATLASRTWTLESSNTSTGPWTLVDTYVDYDVLASQDGATPWTSNKPALTSNTFYRVKVAYNATNAEDVESIYHTFKTGNP